MYARLSLLQSRRQLIFLDTVNVDVDWLDPEYVHNMPIKPNDMTSNQLWVDIELNNPKNTQMVENIVRECKDDGWLRCYTRIVRNPQDPAHRRAKG